MEDDKQQILDYLEVARDLEIMKMKLEHIYDSACSELFELQHKEYPPLIPTPLPLIIPKYRAKLARQ